MHLPPMLILARECNVGSVAQVLRQKGGAYLQLSA